MKKFISKLFFKSELKNIKVAMWLYSYNSKFPEYQVYDLPREIEAFIKILNTYNGVGWKVKLQTTSTEEMLEQLKGR